MNLFPKVAKIARKRLFTSLPRLKVKKYLNPEPLNLAPINLYEMVTP
jgi:hypothetical protein